MMAVAVTVAVLSGFAGIYASFHLKTAAGASVVLAIAGCYLLATLVGWLKTRTAGARHTGSGPARRVPATDGAGR